jgi:NAD(P)H-dependent FMN reductase
MPKLQIIIASTRPGRVGGAVARWFSARAVDHGAFEVELVDLAERNLPLLDEPSHPATGIYVNQHTKDWSATIAAGDAYVFVMPEYNNSFNAALKNAIDYLNKEWKDKAVGLVSYGGVSAGTRAVTAIRPVLVPLSLTCVAPAVNIPFVGQKIAADGSLEANEVMDTSADALLSELARVEAALSTLRG